MGMIARNTDAISMSLPLWVKGDVRSANSLRRFERRGLEKIRSRSGHIRSACNYEAQIGNGGHVNRRIFQRSGVKCSFIDGLIDQVCYGTAGNRHGNRRTSISRGFTPSVYSVMPKLLERSGAARNGSITGLYTVLVEGDDMNEPISDTVRGILDGHIVLSRELAHNNHYPSIDILASVSRLMPDIADKSHLEKAGFVKKILATYRQAQDLISIGAYKPGFKRTDRQAIELIDL